MKPKKLLQDLNLMDRFLFAEAMEDPENMRTLLDIILGKDIVLKELPQTEKEQRSSPLYRFVKLDVWAKDAENTVYNTEVQNKDTKNLPKRSRFYQSLIDGKLLAPGEIDFNELNSVYVIVIASFDLFGYDKYRYTFRMNCEEFPELSLNDSAVRIFLNTRGTNPQDVSPELVELLRYMQNTTRKTVDSCQSKRIQELQERIALIKSNEEVNIR